MKNLCTGLLALSVLAGCQLSDATDEPLIIQANVDSDFAAHWLSPEVMLISPNKDATRFLLVNSQQAVLDDAGTPANIWELSISSEEHPETETVPHLAEFKALVVPDIANIKSVLKTQLAVAQLDDNGKVLTLSYVQTPKLLDSLYTSKSNDADEESEIGVYVEGENTKFSLWAPTAKSVALNLYDDSKTLIKQQAMLEDEKGFWRVISSQAPQGTYYRYSVEVYHPRTQQIEQLEVTDPYSLSLSRNSQYSQVVDLNSEQSQPEGWAMQKLDNLSHPESLILYETHIRDFSASDTALSNPDFAGKYKAFSESDSFGAKHLQQLREAGLNTIHLLPTYDISTVNEDPSLVIYPNDSIEKLCRLMSQLDVCETVEDKSISLHKLLSSYDTKTGDAQALIEKIRPYDAYNWGYDPYHYTVPEGSYALNPEGIPRIVEFREMVQSIHNKGFRVIMDVVYNHTFASGLDDKSVLDKVVPNYYHRLNPITGAVETSTCCENSAAEHRMMAKLMIDSLVVWARDYKIDGFRFDLMGHQPKAEMLEAREAVRAVDPDTYFYGEGWNFGEVANNAQFEQAAQLPLAGTEIGTFTDRLRDAVRGGSSFVSAEALRFGQGIGNGLVVQPNDLQSKEKMPEIMAEYYLSMDQIRVGLAGNLRDFPLENADGDMVTGADIDYGGAPAGYALDPADTINYVSKHDNQTLWDNNSYRFAHEATTEQRVRMHNLSLAIPLVAQGIPFLHMGGEFLRSKSFLRDSYDYNRWFNVVDFAKQGNNYDVGLPPAVKDEANWDIIKDLMAKNEGRDKVSPHDIEFASNVFMDFIAIRSGSPLFSLQTKEQVIERVKFHNTGKNQELGLIAMSIADGGETTVELEDLDSRFDSVMVLINSDIKTKTFSLESAESYRLHPRQTNGADDSVKQAKVEEGAFVVPALTVAVFVK